MKIKEANERTLSYVKNFETQNQERKTSRVKLNASHAGKT